MSAAEIARKIGTRLCRWLSTSRVKEACDSMAKQPGNWSTRRDGEIERVKPYPMSFHPDFGRGHMNNIYWAIGWGTHQSLFPWERFALRSYARAILEAKP
jgi:hypothetical protein